MQDNQIENPPLGSELQLGESELNKSLEPVGSDITIQETPKPLYEEWYQTVPLGKNNIENYDLEKAFSDLPYEDIQKFVNEPDYHLPSTYKKPTHPTFSNESIYHTEEMPGGVWKEYEKGKWEFTPSEHNINNLGGKEQFKKWFDENEPNAKLNILDDIPKTETNEPVQEEVKSDRYIAPKNINFNSAFKSARRLFLEGTGEDVFEWKGKLFNIETADEVIARGKNEPQWIYPDKAGYQSNKTLEQVQDELKAQEKQKIEESNKILSTPKEDDIDEIGIVTKSKQEKWFEELKRLNPSYKSTIEKYEQKINTGEISNEQANEMISYLKERQRINQNIEILSPKDNEYEQKEADREQQLKQLEQTRTRTNGKNIESYADSLNEDIIKLDNQIDSLTKTKDNLTGEIKNNIEQTYLGENTDKINNVLIQKNEIETKKDLLKSINENVGNDDVLSKMILALGYIDNKMMNDVIQMLDNQNPGYGSQLKEKTNNLNKELKSKESAEQRNIFIKEMLKSLPATYASLKTGATIMDLIKYKMKLIPKEKLIKNLIPGSHTVQAGKSVIQAGTKVGSKIEQTILERGLKRGSDVVKQSSKIVPNVANQSSKLMPYLTKGLGIASKILGPLSWVWAGTETLKSFDEKLQGEFGDKLRNQVRGDTTTNDRLKEFIDGVGKKTKPLELEIGQREPGKYRYLEYLEIKQNKIDKNLVAPLQKPFDNLVKISKELSDKDRQVFVENILNRPMTNEEKGKEKHQNKLIDRALIDLAKGEYKWSNGNKELLTKIVNPETRYIPQKQGEHATINIIDEGKQLIDSYIHWLTRRLNNDPVFRPLPIAETKDDLKIDISTYGPDKEYYDRNKGLSYSSNIFDFTNSSYKFVVIPSYGNKSNFTELDSIHSIPINLFYEPVHISSFTDRIEKSRRKKDHTLEQTPVVAINKNGNIQVGEYKDFIGQDVMLSEGYSIPLNFDYADKIKLKRTSTTINRKSLVSKVDGKEYLLSLSLGREANKLDSISPNDLIKYNGYGNLEGGKIILKAGGKTVYVSGGMANIYNTYRELKDNFGDVTAYIFDAGSYNLPVDVDDGKLTKEKLNSYYRRTEDYTGSGLALKIGFSKSSTKSIQNDIYSVEKDILQIEAYIPNKGSVAKGRPDVNDPKFIVLHHTGTKDFKSVHKIFTDQKEQVSSHYVIDKNGTIYNYVNPKDIAWHAGQSEYKGYENINEHSIGIEFVNTGKENDALTKEQLKSSTRLLQYLKHVYKINDEDIIDHKTIKENYREKYGKESTIEKVALLEKQKARIDSVLKVDNIGFDYKPIGQQKSID